MVIRDELFGVGDALADSPAAISTVHVVDEHLQMFVRLGREGKAQTSVHGIAELPFFCLVLVCGKSDRIRKISRVLHLNVLRSQQRVCSPLKHAIRTDRHFYMLGKRIIEDEVVFAHDGAVAIAVIVNFDIEQ